MTVICPQTYSLLKSQQRHMVFAGMRELGQTSQGSLQSWWMGWEVLLSHLQCENAWLKKDAHMAAGQSSNTAQQCSLNTILSFKPQHGPQRTIHRCHMGMIVCILVILATTLVVMKTCLFFWCLELVYMSPLWSVTLSHCSGHCWSIMDIIQGCLLQSDPTQLCSCGISSFNFKRWYIKWMSSCDSNWGDHWHAVDIYTQTLYITFQLLAWHRKAQQKCVVGQGACKNGQMTYCNTLETFNWSWICGHCLARHCLARHCLRHSFGKTASPSRARSNLIDAIPFVGLTMTTMQGLPWMGWAELLSHLQSENDWLNNDA